jgi:hypothetical protein
MLDTAKTNIFNEFVSKTFVAHASTAAALLRRIAAAINFIAMADYPCVLRSRKRMAVQSSIGPNEGQQRAHKIPNAQRQCLSEAVMAVLRT